MTHHSVAASPSWQDLLVQGLPFAPPQRQLDLQAQVIGPPAHLAEGMDVAVTVLEDANCHGISDGSSLALAVVLARFVQQVMPDEASPTEWQHLVHQNDSCVDSALHSASRAADHPSGRHGTQSLPVHAPPTLPNNQVDWPANTSKAAAAAANPVKDMCARPPVTYDGTYGCSATASVAGTRAMLMTMMDSDGAPTPGPREL